jgi:hypothetical protein
MKQIGAEIGVNESRVSQLHARAVQRLKKALGSDASENLLAPVVELQKTMRRMRMAKAELSKRAVVLQYRAPASAKSQRRRAEAASERAVAPRAAAR